MNRANARFSPAPLMLAERNASATPPNPPLDPIGRPSRTVGRGLTLRHNAFEAHLAGVREHGRAVGLDVLVQAQAERGAQRL